MSDHRQSEWAFVDWARSVHTCDVGLPGFALAVTVDADGEDKLWVIDSAQLGRADADSGNARPDHEIVGPLLARFLDRVAAAPLRCCRPTATGSPCRLIVHQPGPCHLHAHTDRTPR